jgi:hypothetical protein
MIQEIRQALDVFKPNRAKGQSGIEAQPEL